MTDVPGGGGGAEAPSGRVTCSAASWSSIGQRPKARMIMQISWPDAGNEVEQRERAVISRLGEDSPVDPDRESDDCEQNDAITKINVARTPAAAAES